MTTMRSAYFGLIGTSLPSTNRISTDPDSSLMRGLFYFFGEEGRPRTAGRPRVPGYRTATLVAARTTPRDVVRSSGARALTHLYKIFQVDIVGNIDRRSQRQPSLL